MWSHKYNLLSKVGSYLGKDNVTKYIWENAGKILENDNGKKMIMIKRSFNPAGCILEPGKNGQINDHILMTMSEVKNDDNFNKEEKLEINRNSSKYSLTSIDDEIPF